MNLHDLFEDLPAHVKKSDLPPTMRGRLSMRDVEKERPQGAFRYRVGDREFLDLGAAKEFASGTGQQIQPIREEDKSPGKIDKSEDPCWSGYHMVGTKKKAGRTVPNCVPGEKGATSEGKDSSTPRIERILRQLRIRHPEAKDDLEALIYSFQDSAREDRRDINRLDQENDQEESDIEAIQKMIDAIRAKHGAMAESKKSVNVPRSGPNEEPVR